ncbi:type II toxin-antitoxin system VapC family toxin [Methylocaldum gracile subsp. desertum]|uniref:type II toxin-antitoxin system VapC family toxin n=1 Tax=Methylocaldum sp. GT1BW TaxID=3438964 RepID=UPI003DA0ED84
MWLPDTNVWIRYLNPAPSPVNQRFIEHLPESIVLCDVVKAELYFGAYKSQRREANLSLLETLFAQFVSLPFDGNAARLCGELRADLARKGKPIGPYDLQIAAVALANDLTLVTHNTVEFGRIDGLRLEDWEI